VKTPDSERDADLHAAVDGQIDQAEQTRIDAWLADNPEDAATVHAYRLQNARLHDRYDDVLNETLPPHLLGVIESPSVYARRGWTGRLTGIRRLAASLAFLIAGGAGGWMLHGQMVPSASPVATAAATGFADKAIGAHKVFVAEVRHPVEVPASDEPHLVAWLSKRLGTTLRAPDMNDVGFSLVGGRLLADLNLPVAQFMYQDDNGRRLTLYVRSTDETGRGDAIVPQDAAELTSSKVKTAFHFVKHGGVSAFYWIDNAFSYALVAPLDRPGLLAIAIKVYTELDN